MTYVLTSAPAWISIDTTAQTLNGSPPNTASTLSFSVAASDKYMGSVSISVLIYLNANNGP